MMGFFDQPKVTPTGGRMVYGLEGKNLGGRPSTDEEKRQKVREYTLNYARKNAAKLRLNKAKQRIKRNIRTAENRITILQGNLTTWREQLAKLETVEEA